MPSVSENVCPVATPKSSASLSCHITGPYVTLSSSISPFSAKPCDRFNIINYYILPLKKIIFVIFI